MGVLNGELRGFGVGRLFGMISKQTYYPLNLGKVKPHKSDAAGGIPLRTELYLRNPYCVICVRVFVSARVCHKDGQEKDFGLPIKLQSSVLNGVQFLPCGSRKYSFFKKKTKNKTKRIVLLVIIYTTDV